MTPEERGKLGGRSRAKSLTAAERSEAARAAARERWSKPVSTHDGTLEIGDLALPCYVLEDERRVFSLSGLVAALGMSPGGNVKRAGEGNRLLRFVTGKALHPQVPANLLRRLREPINFRLANGTLAFGYPAEILPELCEAVLKSRDAGVLQRQQWHIAMRCELIVRGLARVGVIALVDEATGFQYTRTRRALAAYLDRFIEKELAQWVKTFPDEYYAQLFRLYGLTPSASHHRPAFFGHVTNNYVYSRLAPAVLEELRTKNPKANGRRKACHHQWLTRELGHPKLVEHLNMLLALMRVANSKTHLDRMIDRALPKFNSTLELPFTDEIEMELGA